MGKMLGAPYCTVGELSGKTQALLLGSADMSQCQKAHYTEGVPHHERINEILTKASFGVQLLRSTGEFKRLTRPERSGGNSRTT